ncbi:DeoR/GlpR family DNA-binding transcription regulator [uncultured Parolsenella sp.]|uniref:DeoR/GlpR family DNA-binding transcription regulator n=1 Tax=uncultured Parolsenella sp. TaxID=2083008 RepID=UPI0025D718E8|nr:DeoR/GlpR family DNA-binding transcription regulator [uncultured Parolsenella sp.]
MFPKERRKQILEMVNASGFATVENLSKHFGVSVDSIRKDLKVLQNEGKIKREYGGALKVDEPPVEEAPSTPAAVAEREAVVEQGRRDVAARAWLEINDGDAIFLGVSRTNVYLADLIAAGDKRLIVTTNMIDVLQRLAGNPKVTALATGGYLNVLNNGFTGPACISLLEPLLFSKAFLGTCGVDLGTSAVLATTTDDGKVDDQVLKNASYRFLLADHEKFSIHSGYRFASISDFTAVITDSNDHSVLRAIAAMGTPVLC